MTNAFDFFRQHLQDTQGVDIEAGIAEQKPRVEYPFVTFVPFVLGVADALYCLFVWLGFFFWQNGALLSAARSAEHYATLVIFLNIFAIFCGVAAVALSNKKMYPVIGTLLCLVIEIPLLAIQYHFLGFTLRGLP